MKIELPYGAMPTMITPFTQDDQVDYPALAQMIEWYIDNDVSALFAVCQSSEMFQLSLEERVAVSRFVAKKVNGRIPVVASGHISDSPEEQADELNAIANTGVDGIVLITCKLADMQEPDSKWIQNMDRLLSRLKGDLPLGLYECPYPYKRVITEKIADYLADCKRFSFLKDTSCDMSSINMKLARFRGCGLQLFNANTATLLESILNGASGYCGVMGNFHPKLYKTLLDHCREAFAQKLADELTMLSYIEKQLYPANAKYYLRGEGIAMTDATRVKDHTLLSETNKSEIEMLRRITYRMYNEYQ